MNFEGFLPQNEIDELNKRIEDLEKHASVANSEMSEVKESLIALNTKMDIIMRHLKL